jgi:hypothetical protein
MVHSVINDNKQEDRNTVFNRYAHTIKALYIDLLGQPTIVTNRLWLIKQCILHTVLRHELR